MRLERSRWDIRRERDGFVRPAHEFVFEEDGDLGHGLGKSNIVRTWKEQNGLEFYFNCHNSPDLARIENCWQLVK